MHKKGTASIVSAGSMIGNSSGNQTPKNQSQKISSIVNRNSNKTSIGALN